MSGNLHKKKRVGLESFQGGEDVESAGGAQKGRGNCTPFPHYFPWASLSSGCS